MIFLNVDPEHEYICLYKVSIPFVDHFQWSMGIKNKMKEKEKRNREKRLQTFCALFDFRFNYMG